MNKVKSVPASSALELGGTAGLIASLMGSRLSPRLRRVLAAGVAAGALYRLGQKGYARLHNAFTWTVTVDARDGVYDELHDWLLDSLPPAQRKALLARTSKPNYSDYEIVPDGVESKVRRVTLLYDGTRTQTVKLGGHRVKVRLDRESASTVVQASGSSSSSLIRESIIFSVNTPAGRDAVVELLGVLAAKMTERKPRVFVATSWGSWRRHDELGARSINSVIVAEGVAEDMLADLRSFQVSEEAYVRLGIPWHRGYLFEGPAGTGKTSLARALASECDMDVYYLPLSDVREDGHVADLIRQVERGAMLLLEDVDVVGATNEREGQNDQTMGVTLAGLLNGLDGVITPHGLVTVMTTNRVEVLDSALIRSGRIDRQVHIGYLDAKRTKDLLRLFLPSQPGDVKLRDDVSPADIVGVVKRYIGDEAGAYQAIREELT